MPNEFVSPLLYRFLSRAQVTALIDMHQAEVAQDLAGAEIVCDKECWLGSRRVSARTIEALLKEMLITERLEAGGVRRYLLNSAGRQCLTNPDIVVQIRAALRDGTSIEL